MKLFMTFALSLFLAQSLLAFSSAERSKLLAQVKASKSFERKALSKRIVRFKQSNNFRSRHLVKHRKGLKFKKRLKRKKRLQKTRPKRVP